MLYDVETISNLTNVSKVTIYSKLKLKDIKPYVIKKLGKSYVEEEGFTLIKNSLELKNKDESDTLDDALNIDKTSNSGDLINLKDDLINTLKSEVDFLREEMKEKNKQLEAKDKLIENMQVLIKNEQSKQNIKQDDLLLLEEHFNSLDNKLSELREKMLEGKDHNQSSKKEFFKKIFGISKNDTERFD